MCPWRISAPTVVMVAKHAGHGLNDVFRFHSSAHARNCSPVAAEHCLHGKQIKNPCRGRQTETKSRKSIRGRTPLALGREKTTWRWRYFTGIGGVDGLEPATPWCYRPGQRTQLPLRIDAIEAWVMTVATADILACKADALPTSQSPTVQWQTRYSLNWRSGRGLEPATPAA